MIMMRDDQPNPDLLVQLLRQDAMQERWHSERRNFLSVVNG
jgi:hypothetical protein